jgi:hypothetical protein
MATVTKVRRMHNPQRTRKRRRNAAKRRKLTPRQIKFFGTARQKAGLKAARKRKRTMSGHRRRSNPTTRISKRVVHVYRPNPKRRRKANKAKRHVRRTRRNPALVLTLGAVNPQRRKSVAQHKRKRRKATARRNPSRRRTRIVVASAPRKHRRRTNPRRHARRGHRRRNPQLFGSQLTGANTVKMIGGGLVGVAAAKLLPTLLPAGMVSGNIMRVVVTGASAFVAHYIAKMAKLGDQVSGAVLFGGLMQTGSVALNVLLPNTLAARFSLGELVASQNPCVPNNPLRAMPAPTTPGNRIPVSGLSRSFGSWM